MPCEVDLDIETRVPELLKTIQDAENEIRSLCHGFIPTRVRLDSDWSYDRDETTLIVHSEPISGLLLLESSVAWLDHFYGFVLASFKTGFMTERVLLLGSRQVESPERRKTYDDLPDYDEDYE